MSTRRVVVGAASGLPEDVLLTREDPPFSGPAAGVAAGLAVLEPGADWMLLLACDQPDAEGIVAALTASPPQGEGRCIADADGHNQWLQSLVNRAALESALARLETPRDRSMRALLGSLSLEQVTGPGGRDVDTWDDWHWWHRRKGRDMTDLGRSQQDWQAWLDQVAAAAGVTAQAVDVAGVHDLTRQVSHRLVRPMGPVSAYIAGLAVARGADFAGAVAAIEGVLPAEQP